MQVTQDLSRSVEGKHVIVVEDIVDTGLTMAYLLENLATRRPASVRIASLLHKPARAKVEVAIDYLGFEIPDRFVVGYGLDYANKLRNLPFIGVNIGVVALLSRLRGLLRYAFLSKCKRCCAAASLPLRTKRPAKFSQKDASRLPS